MTAQHDRTASASGRPCHLGGVQPAHLLRWSTIATHRRSIGAHVDVRLMIEGQESVTWPQWRALAEAAEAARLDGLFRSDHYQSVQGRTERSSLDAWATLAALGPLTSTLRLGTMVSPTTFRHPSVLAKNVVTADHTSQGRVELGIGAGWHQLEHDSYGIPFPDLATRYDVFEEQVEIVVRQLTEERFTFEGEHHTLVGCEARPKPVQQPKVPVIVGGLAGPRSARIAGRWADEYNTVFPSPETLAERRVAIERACAHTGRASLRLSMMTGCLLGADEAELRDRAARLHQTSGQDGDADAWLDSLRETWIVGTPEQAAERLEDYRRVGLDRVYLQHQLHDDLDMVALAGTVADAVRT